MLGDLTRRIIAVRWYLFDALVAVVLVAASTDQSQPPPPEWWVFAVVAAASLLVRRRWPLWAFVAAGLATVVRHLDPAADFTPIDLAVALTLYTQASSDGSRRRGAVTLGAALACVSLVSAAQVTLAPAGEDGRTIATTDYQALEKARLAGIELPVKAEARSDGVGDLVAAAFGRALTAFLVLGLAFAIGDGVRSRRAYLRTIEKRAEDLEREQRQRVALATAAERARITRDLHDVVAHGLSVMVVQAQGGAAALDRHPDRTATALQNVITTGRASLTEMRRLLDVVRQGPGEAAHLAPQPGTGSLPDLVDGVRAAGTPVTLSVDGDPVPLPLSVDLSVFRIVQEALTNTLKYAGPGARATVRLTYRPGHVEVEVVDDGAGSAVPTGSGSGLRGLTERVAILGGEFSAGPLAGGGFGARAVLPVGPAEGEP